jgi:hypothetical protein
MFELVEDKEKRDERKSRFAANIRPVPAHCTTDI